MEVQPREWFERKRDGNITRRMVGEEERWKYETRNAPISDNKSSNLIFSETTMFVLNIDKRKLPYISINK